MPAPGSLIRHDLSTARAAPGPHGPAGVLWHLICRLALRLGGWRIAGDWPAEGKLVVTAGPHTSNWDGIWMLAAAGVWRVRLCYMGKASLTRGPFGWLVKLSGCIPIDRSQRNDVVGTMRRAFGAASDLILVVPPEGTRDRVESWKSGFWHIARGAGVPITMAVMDYRTRTVSLPATLWPSDDYLADLAVIQSFYAPATPKYPDKFVLTGR